MLSKLGRHLTYANVTATLALVFAMSGGALAATHYLISSTRQISPRVLRTLRGRTGPRGPVGPAGAAAKSLTGKTGKEGPRGYTGSTGANGQSVTSLAFTGSAGPCAQGGSAFTSTSGATYACNGNTGGEGSPWTAGGTLPSGKTETGTWAFVSHAEGAVRVPLSFTIPTKEPLAGGPHAIPVEVVLPKEEDPLDAHPECPGTVAEPKANAGTVCVYAETLEAPYETVAAVRTSGVVLVFHAAGASPLVDEGTWAATAP